MFVTELVLGNSSPACLPCSQPFPDNKTREEHRQRTPCKHQAEKQPHNVHHPPCHAISAYGHTGRYSSESALSSHRALCNHCVLLLTARISHLASLSSLSNRCFKCKCSGCGKFTWQGCGAHIESALAGVPDKDRCAGWQQGRCQPAATVLQKKDAAPKVLKSFGVH